MYCGYCGKEIKGTAEFCPYCGKKTEEDKKEEKTYRIKPSKETLSEENSPGENNILISFVAACIAAASLIAGVPSLIGVLKSILVNLPYLFRWGISYAVSFVGSVMVNLFMLLTIIILAFTNMLMTIDFRKGQENVYFAALSAQTVVYALLSVFNMIFIKIRSAYIPFSTLGAEAVKTVSIIAVPTVIMYVLFTLFTQRPFRGLSGNEIQNEYINMMSFMKDKMSGVFSAIMDRHNAKSQAESNKKQETDSEERRGYSHDKYQTIAISKDARTYSDSTDVPPMGGNRRLNPSRALWKYILFNILTCGLYSFFFVYDLARDLNACCDGDGNSTAGLFKLIVFSFLTCGLYYFYWTYKIGNRMWTNSYRYRLRFAENGTSILLWEVLGTLLCGLGPFVALHIIIKNSNALCLAYNQQVLGKGV